MENNITQDPEYPGQNNDLAKTLRAVHWITWITLTLLLTLRVRDNPPPPHVSFEIEADPVTGQGRVATINNQTGYAVTNLVLRGTTVRFDLVLP